MPLSKQFDNCSVGVHFGEVEVNEHQATRERPVAILFLLIGPFVPLMSDVITDLIFGSN